MNQDPIYRVLIFILFVLVPLHDMGSYFVGTLFGRHKIAPQISPGKTWEGFVGGFVTASFGVFIMRRLLLISTSSTTLLIFTFIVCTIAFLGDLFESLLKRTAHIKDSSNILPGHGGVLDRLDGILFVGSLFFVFRDYLVRLLIKQ